MAIVQEAFDIPADIMTGLLTGEYKRIGGVVRYAIGPNRGRIVKHLKPIDIKAAEDAQGVMEKGAEVIKANKQAAAIIGVGAVVVGGIVIAYRKARTSEPKVLKEFRAALKQYIDAIRVGEMNLEIIKHSEDSLYALKQNKNYNKYVIKLTADDIEVLVNKIQEYTIKLAKDNDLDLLDFNKDKSDDTIINLERYLTIQKKIFEVAA